MGSKGDTGIVYIFWEPYHLFCGTIPVHPMSNKGNKEEWTVTRLFFYRLFAAYLMFQWIDFGPFVVAALEYQFIYTSLLAHFRFNCKGLATKDNVHKRMKIETN